MEGQTDAFKKLAERYGVPGSDLFKKVLGSLITPEEGEVLLALQRPMTVQELASEAGIQEDQVRIMLQDIKKRGVIRSSEGKYSLPPHIMLLCHWTQNRSDKVDKIWTEFFFEEWRYKIAEEAHKRRLTGKWSTHRIVPAIQALAASPHIPRDKILWYENYEAMFRRAKKILFLPCSCRTQHRQCDNKMELCVHVILDDDENENRFDRILERWPHLKPLTYQEAMDEMCAAEDAGLGHLSLNFPRLEECCNWCECCCRVVNPLIHAGLDYDLMDPSKSRFLASVDPEICNGCQTCMERCIFNAIEMVKVTGSKKMKAQISEKYCMGCGLCVYTCPQKAITFNIVRPPEHIPNVKQEDVFSWGSPSTEDDIRRAFAPRTF